VTLAVQNGNRLTARSEGKESKMERNDTKNAWELHGIPSNLDAEEGVLGSLLIMPESIDEIASILKPADFVDESHRRIYSAIADMYAAGKKVDPVLLVDELRRRKQLDEVGGYAKLGKLTKAVPHCAHLVYYANLVIEEALRRALIEASSETIRDVVDQKDHARSLLTVAEGRLATLSEGRTIAKAETIKEVLHQSIDAAEHRKAGASDAGSVRTGFTGFDSMTGGLREGELVILAARPSMGKSAWALNVATNVAAGADDEAGKVVLFVSLEMSKVELGMRLLSSEGRVDGHRLQRGTFNDDDRRRIKEAYGRISPAGLFVEDAPYRTVTSIAAAARLLKRREGSLSLIVIDYLQLLEADDHKIPREQQVARMTRRLKGLARDLKVPVLCLAQLNRQTEQGGNNRPRLAHLRESGAIEQDADVVLFVHREEYYLPPGKAREEVAGQAEIIVAKQRNGPIGEVKLAWSPSYTRFDTLAPKRHDSIDQWNRRDEEPAYTGNFTGDGWGGN
jgi:replicative DNA helicase